MWAQSLGAFALVAVSFLTGAFSRRKSNADASATVTEAALSLIEPQNKRIDELVKAVTAQSLHISQLELRIHSLQAHIDILSGQIISLGAEPIQLKEAS